MIKSLLGRAAFFNPDTEAFVNSVVVSGEVGSSDVNQTKADVVHVVTLHVSLLNIDLLTVKGLLQVLTDIDFGTLKRSGQPIIAVLMDVTVSVPW